MAQARTAAKGGGSVSRRHFLGSAAAAGAAFTIVPRHVLGAGQTPPSAKPNVGAVGVGGVGYDHMSSADQTGFHMACLCDLDHGYAKRAFDRWPQARRYRDFREMLEAEGDKIDAVYCGTPDHTHAIITLAAIRRGKHVCCVKPLTRTVQECRAVVEAARRAKVATQVTAAPNTTEAGSRTCELIWAGAIGPVREAHVWSDRPVWPQGMARPAGEDPLPSGMDWKLWLGPAPYRPFKNRWPEGSPALTMMNIPESGSAWHKSVYHPFNFRGWWDFGTGALGDMGTHFLNTPFRALKLGSPTHVFATATRVTKESAPLASIVTYEYPARGDMPPVRVIWYDGGIKPPTPPELHGRTLGPDGVLYIGDEGKMLNSAVLSTSRARKFESVPRTLRRRSGTFGEWLEAIHGGEPAGCNFDWAGPITETLLLGNVAIRRGKPLDWDGAKGRITNDPDANAYISEPYQNGWKLEA